MALIWLAKSGPSTGRLEVGAESFLNLVVEDARSCYLGGGWPRPGWSRGTCPACGGEKFKVDLI
jgi:hypothetical protein